MVELLPGAGFLNLSMAASFVAAALALYFLVQQLSYHRKKGPLPGPPLVLPFFGSIVQMVSEPTQFWVVKAAQARDSGLGLAADFLVGKFVLFIRDSELSHQVFANVRPDAFHVLGHPFGKKLWGEHNLIYKFGDEQELRRRVAPNFTPRALSTYAALQQRVILAYIRRWLDQSAGAMSLRVPCRDMNLETSQMVFVGPYLTEKTRQSFGEEYNLFNTGVMAMPVDLPGFAFGRSRLAVERLSHMLADCARESKARMRAGREPECLADYWMQEIVRDIDEAAAAGQPPPANTDDKDLGNFLFDFLFAAQDASTSSICWAVSALESHPARPRPRRGSRGLVAGVRRAHDRREDPGDEVHAGGGARGGPLPPPGDAGTAHGRRGVQADGVVHGAQGVGTLVFPSVYESSFQGFTSPDEFDPDRFFSEDRREDVVYRRNYLAFGAGGHQCIGQRYALYHLVLFLALFVSVADFKRDRTKGCDDLVYMPTIVPRDGCTVFLKQRCAAFPSF